MCMTKSGIISLTIQTCKLLCAWLCYKRECYFVIDVCCKRIGIEIKSVSSMSFTSVLCDDDQMDEESDE